MKQKNMTEELIHSLVYELKSSEILPLYSAKRISDIAAEICKRKESLASTLKHFMLYYFS